LLIHKTNANTPPLLVLLFPTILSALNPSTLLLPHPLPALLTLAYPTPVSLAYAVIDVTIPSPPSFQGDAPFTEASATRPHHLAERKKFPGGSTSANSSIVQSLLVDQNMLLFPATFDHLGGLGQLAL
jgi:hypothetical protein